MKKRLLAWTLCLALALSLVPATALAAEAHPFQDVPKDHWANEGVQYVYEEGLMDGVDTTVFHPSGTLTRAMFVTILGRLDGVPESKEAKSDFSDVESGQWYTSYVEWAAQEGIVNGYGNNRFGPDDPVTREQMSAILYRYSQHKEYDTKVTGDLTRFHDAGEVSEYAFVPMSWAVGAALIEGLENDTLAPAGTATRAQAATILMRFCETVVEEPEPVPTIYTVTFAYNYGNKGTYTTLTVEDGQSVECPNAPTRSGYTFEGWYTKSSGGEKYDFSTVVTGDMTLYAHWDKVSSGGGGTVVPPEEPEQPSAFTVTFDSNGGSLISDQTVLAGNIAENPKEPTKEGYIFGGWINEEDSSRYDFTEKVTSDVSLYAIWQKIYNDNVIYRSEESDITFDEESDTLFYNNLLLVYTTETLNEEQAEAIASSAGGAVVGRVSGAVNLLQIIVSATDIEGLNAIADRLMKFSTVYYASYDIPFDAVSNAVTDDLNPWSDSGEIISDKGNEDEPGGNDKWAEMIHAYTAWTYSDETTPITVGIIDSGIEDSHDEFDGKIEVMYGKNTGKLDHGTQVAGVLAAENNKIGIRGVADHAKILFADRNPVSDDKEEWQTAEYISAIENMIDRGAKVINMSVGFEIQTEAEYMDSQGIGLFKSYKKYLNSQKKSSQKSAEHYIAMIEGLLNSGKKDFIIVQAAGNDYCDVELNGWFSAINQETYEKYCKKSKYSLSEVKDHILVVGGTSSSLDNGTYHMWATKPGQGSNYGEEIDICAPALLVYTTTENNTYTKEGVGTSLAAPMVAGAAAYIWSLDPTLDAKKVRDTLLSTPDRAKSGDSDSICEYKMLNVGDATTKIRNELGSVGGKTCLNDMDNTPISAEIEVYRNGAFYRSTSSDSETGEFNIKLPEGDYKLVFQKKGYTVEKGFDTYDLILNRGTIYIIKNPIKFTQIETPEVPPSIYGKVVDMSTQVPIKNAVVYLYCLYGKNNEDIGARVETRADGSFNITIPDNAIDITRLQVTKEGG